MPSEQELLNTYRKLEQDIAELTTKRSNLQNEIEAKEKESKDGIASEYAEHQKKIDAGRLDFEKFKKAELEAIDKQKADIAAQNAGLRAEWKKVGDEATALNKERSDFKEYRDAEQKRLDSNFVYVAQEEDKNKQRAKELDEIAKGQAERKASLDNLKFQTDYSIDENNKILARITAEKEEKKVILYKTTEEKTAIEEEVKRVEGLLEELKLKEVELQKLESLKVDIVKLENLKAEVDAKIKQSEELSKANALKTVELNEKAETLSEQNRLLILEMRKNDEKIKTIQTLREAMKKDA